MKERPSKTGGILFLSLLAVSILVGGLWARTAAWAQGTAPQAALGTAFTYQGRLLDGGTPATGTYDFEFRLYDAASGGTQVGPTLTKTGVAVSDGYFTVQLDFGNVFNGSALWLQIAVRPSGGGSYTSLGRQALTAAPFAAFAQKAPWSGLTGVPAGFADNADDDTLAGLSCAGGQVPKWNGSAWTCAADSDTTYTAGTGLSLSGTQFSVNFAGTGTATTAARSDHNHDATYQKKYVRTLIVSPVGDGTDAAANGAALLNALNSITATTSPTRAYLIRLEPGIYDVGNTPFQMKPYVDLEGSGQGVTILKGAGQNSTTTGVLVGAQAEVRNLTVESYGGATYAIAVYNAYTLTLRNVTISAYNASTENIGVLNAKNLDVYDSVIYADGSTSSGYAAANAVGLRSTGANNFLRIFDSEVSASVDTAGKTGAGLDLQSSYAEVFDTRIDALGIGGGTTYGIYSNASRLFLRNAVVGGFTTYGLWFQGSAYLNVDRSTLSGLTYSLYNDGGTAKVGASQLDGPITNTVSGGGSLRCVYTYDGTYSAVACP